MKGRAFFWLVAFPLIATAGLAAEAAVRPAPRPLVHHPGNVFLAGEEITLSAVPGRYGMWKVLDIDGNVVAEGGEAEAGLGVGKLPVGYYTVEVEDRTSASLAVLEPLAAPVPSDGPICVQTSFAPQYILGRLSNIDEAVNLAALAGVSGIRDNAAWPWEKDEKGNPRRDGSREAESFDLLLSAVRREGLDLLVVIEPGTPDAFALPQDWGVRTRKKFPRDLRDYARFVRHVVEKGGDVVSVWEAWNEPEGIGGLHLGGEIVSAMKTFTLAARSVRPEVRTAMGMGHVPAEAMERNGYAGAVTSYHFHSHGAEGAAEKKRRALDGFADSRPVWVTEASYGAYASGEKTADLTPEEERRQARDIPKIFARSLHAGNERVFYFLFPNFGETAGKFWGVLGPRRLEPRPSYLSLAASGRLLAGARPAGGIAGLPAGLEGWAFHARPDGKSRAVLVLWAENDQKTAWQAPEGAEIYDLWGRRVTGPGERVVNGEPRFVVLPEEKLQEIALHPIRDRSAALERSIAPLCPVVADFRRPERLKNHQGESFLFPETTPRLNVDVYNFGGETLRGTWKAEAPEGFDAIIVKQPGEIPPAGRAVLEVELRRKALLSESANDSRHWLTLRGDYGTHGESLIAIPFLHSPSVTQALRTPISGDAKRWRSVAAGGTKMDIRPDGDRTLFTFQLGPAPNQTIGTTWAAPVYPLRKVEAPPSGTWGIGLTVQLAEVPEGTSIEINLVKHNGASWSCPLPFSRENAASFQQVSFVLPLQWFAHIKHRQPDSAGQLALADIAALEVAVIGLPGTRVTLGISDLHWLANPESP
jgi:hypothetical protein